MTKIHKITKGGKTIYPATTTDAVVNPKSRKNLTEEISEMEVSQTNLALKTTVYKSIKSFTIKDFTRGTLDNSSGSIIEKPNPEDNVYSFLKVDCAGVEKVFLQIASWNNNAYYICDDSNQIISDGGNKGTELANYDVIIPTNAKTLYAYSRFNNSKTYVETQYSQNINESIKNINEKIEESKLKIDTPMGVYGTINNVKINFKESILSNDPFIIIADVRKLDSELPESNINILNLGLNLFLSADGKVAHSLRSGAAFLVYLADNNNISGFYIGKRDDSGNVSYYSSAGLANYKYFQSEIKLENIILYGSDKVVIKKIILLKGNFSEQDLQNILMAITQDTDLPSKFNQYKVFEMLGKNMTETGFYNTATGEFVNWNSPNVKIAYGYSNFYEKNIW